MSSKSLKGITISLGGDTVNLQKSLKEVEAPSRALQTELREINKQLKFDPENTVLLAQKQDVLQEQVENSRLALSKLLDAQEAIETATKNGEISTEQYRAFQREIEETKGKLANFERQLEETKQTANRTNLDGLKEELQKTETEIDETKDAAVELEKKTAKINLEPFKKELDDVKKSANELKDSVKDTATELGAGITGAGAAAGAAIMSFDSVEAALNHIQAQTGLTDKQIQEMRGNMEAAYSGNFGDDLTDVANAMAAVVQQQKETDPAKIQKTAENLITLRDVLGYEYAESLRAVNMLTDQFGISSEEAFNLIVQGSQKGLDKNGDLLDSINEYSVHYKQLGYNAEGFFNSLENGTAAGTFSVDKIGDAVKEFGIRSKDSATTTIEGFTLLGYTAEASAKEIQEARDKVEKLEQNLKYAKMEQEGFNDSTSELTKQKNADKIAEYTKQLSAAKDELANLTEKSDGSKNSIEDLQSRFAKGGETARKATQEVLEKLFALDDQVLQNQIGVDLFGTMWEDLGIDGVKALMNVEGQADKTKSSMSDIKDIEYDNLESDLSEIGRTVQTKIINPIGKSLMPDAKKLCNFVADHTDEIVPTLKTISGIVASIWVGRKVADFTQKIQALYSSYKTLKTATDTAKVAQAGLNSAQKANVVGAIISAVGILISTVHTYNETQWENSSLKKEIDEISELNDKWTSVNDEMSNHIKNINDSELALKVDFKNVDDLKTRLQEIIKDGTIDENEEGEYKTIIDLLGEKVDDFTDDWNGLTLEEVDGKIVIKDNIDEVNQKIDDLVANWEITQAKLTFTDTYSNLQTELEKKKIEVNQLKDQDDPGKSRKEFIDYIFENSRFSKKESEILADELIKANGDFYKTAESIRKQFDNQKLDSEKYKKLSQTLGNKFFTHEGGIKAAFFDYNATNRIKEYTDEIIEYNDNIGNAKSNVKELEETLNDYGLSLEMLNGSQSDYNKLIELSTEHGLSQEAVLSLVKDSTIKNWEDLQEAADEQTKIVNGQWDLSALIAEGNTERINAALSVMQGSFVTAESGTKESLEKQVENMTANYENLKTAVDNNAPGVTQSMVDNAKKMVDNANHELDKFKEKSPKSAKAGIKSYTDEFTCGDARMAVNSAIDELCARTGVRLSKKSSGIGEWGGNSLGKGYYDKIISWKDAVFLGAASLALTALEAIQKTQDSHSPSKKAQKLGGYFGTGYRLGIEGEIKNSEKTAKKMVESSLSVLNTELPNFYSSGNNLFSNPILELNSKFANIRSDNQKQIQKMSHTSKTVTKAPSVNLNFGDVVIKNDMDMNEFASRVKNVVTEAFDEELSKWGD